MYLMQIHVIKRDGSTARFDKNKITRVVKATGLGNIDSKAVALSIEKALLKKGVKKITSIKIRDMVITRLAKIDKYATDLYKWYEKTKDHDK